MPVTEINNEYPWLPADPSPDFDPLAHADLAPSKQCPFVVVPRGGTREVGRSCYQLETEHATYLVDCGLNQGTGANYPAFHGLSRGQVDGVFLTHAHIDHSGGLPILETEGYLADDATIVTTRPTAVLAELLLEDSLKIAVPKLLPPEHIDGKFLFVTTCGNAGRYGPDRSDKRVHACALWAALSGEDRREKYRVRKEQDALIPPILENYDPQEPR